jgi:hypothetical protein
MPCRDTNPPKNVIRYLYRLFRHINPVFSKAVQVYVGMPHFENWATLNRILKLHATEEFLFPYNVHSTI